MLVKARLSTRRAPPPGPGRSRSRAPALSADRWVEISLAVLPLVEHVLGLTKTVVPLIRVVAQRGAGLGLPGRSRPPASLPPATSAALSPAEEDIVRWAVNALAGAVPAGCALPRRQAAALTRARIGLRLAALLQLAAALARTHRPGTPLRATVTPGGGLRLCVGRPHGPLPSRAHWRRSTDLWRRFVRTPLQVVADDDGRLARRHLAEPFHRAARRIVWREFQSLHARAYGAHCPDDLEFVHEMRVSARRLQVGLRAFRHALAPGVLALRDRLSAWGKALGVARDADVFAASLQRAARDLPEAHRVLVEAVIAREAGLRNGPPPERQGQSRRWTALRRELRSALGLVPDAVRQQAAPVAIEVPRLLRRHVRRLWRWEPDLSGLTAEGLHRLRIACKRTRYVAEFFQGFYPERLETRLVRHLQRMQRYLGDVHDVDVHMARLHSHHADLLAASPEASREVLQYLADRRVRALAEAEQTWHDVGSPKSRRRLRRLLRLSLLDLAPQRPSGPGRDGSTGG